MIDLDQVVWGAVVFSNTGLFWANDIITFHEPGEVGFNEPLEYFS